MFKTGLTFEKEYDLAVHATQPFDWQAVSLVVSRQFCLDAFLKGQRDKQAIL